MDLPDPLVTLLVQSAEVTRFELSENWIPIVLFVGGFGVAIVSMFFSWQKTVRVESEREQTKREIAAYVAEGSMTTDEAERLLNAGGSSWKGKKGGGGCGRRA